MFVAREKELSQLKESFSNVNKQAILIYGKRRIGKSTLIAKAAVDFDGIVISHICAKTTYEGNLALLSRSVCLALGLPVMNFKAIEDIFSFIENMNKRVLIIIDEYQYFKENARDLDSRLQSVIDRMSDNIRLVLCGSYITMMKELLNEENPLFGRFNLIIHLEEFDYLDSAEFFKEADIRKKIENYAVFGGSPYVLATIEGMSSLKENIVKYLLPQTGVLRVYIESVMLREIQKAYDIRIFSTIGNGKKKYSDINTSLNIGNTGLLDKQLKTLLDMEALRKLTPVNKTSDRRKQFYIISDNLMRFYFTFIFGNEALISRLGEEAYFDNYISTAIEEFISRRFEDICDQYFARKIRAGKITDVLDHGSYWYDDPVNKMNGEFDCVLKRRIGYDFYECKYYSSPMLIGECRKEEGQILAIQSLPVNRIGFICSAGFEEKDEKYDMITGGELYVV